MDRSRLSSCPIWIMGEIGDLRTYESQLAMLLSEEDVTAVAAAMERGSSAAVLVWENLLGGAIRLSCSPVRWSAGRQRPHPGPGPARGDRSRREIDMTRTT